MCPIGDAQQIGDGRAPCERARPPNHWVVTGNKQDPLTTRPPYLRQEGTAMSAKGTPWFKLHSQLREHPKTDDLADELDIEQPLALGHLVSLWCWITDYYPDGHLGTMKPRRIEDAVRWRGVPGAFVAACVKHRWIDQDSEGVMRAHNWFVYAESYNRAQAKKASRETPSAPVTDTGRLSHDTGRDTSQDTSHDTGRDGSQDILRREERRREESERREERRGDDLAALPDDSPLSLADMERVLSRSQLEAPPVLDKLGAGVAGLGNLAPPHTAYPVLASELKMALARAIQSNALKPNYIAGVINGRRADANDPSRRRASMSIEEFTDSIPQHDPDEDWGFESAAH